MRLFNIKHETQREDERMKKKPLSMCVCVCVLGEWQKLVEIREATTTCVLKTSNTNARVRHVPCGRQRVMVGAMQSYESTPNATARAKEAEKKFALDLCFHVGTAVVAIIQT